MAVKDNTRTIPLAVVAELVACLEEALLWVDDDDRLLHRADLAIEDFKFAEADRG